MDDGVQGNQNLSESLIETVSKTKPKKKHRKLIVIITIIVVILITGGITSYLLYQQHENQLAENYNAKITKAVIDISAETYASEGVCEIVSSGWHDAIFKNNQDFNTVIASYEKTLSASDLGKNMQSGKTKIESEIKELQNPYKGYESTYQLVLNLYDEYNGIYNQAISPTGSLTTYNSDVNSKENAFDTTLNRIEVVIPNIKSKISK